MSWFSSKPKKINSLFDAIAQNNAAEVGRFLSQEQFTLIETEGDEGGGGKSALVLEFEDRPVLVAFTANDHATNFARENEGLLDANGELAAFVVGGTDLLMYLPEGVGVVFNPDSAQESIMPPRLVAEVKRLLR